MLCASGDNCPWLTAEAFGITNGFSVVACSLIPFLQCRIKLLSCQSIAAGIFRYIHDASPRLALKGYRVQCWFQHTVKLSGIKFDNSNLYRGMDSAKAA